MKRAHDQHTRSARKAVMAHLAVGSVLTGGVLMVVALGYLVLNMDRADVLIPICIPFAAVGIVLAFTGAAMMLFSRRNRRQNRGTHL